MRTCYSCNEVLHSANKTEEHIIINAVGGLLKSRRIICNKCNRDFGLEIDAALADQLKIFSNLLNIKRDRGVVPTIELEETHSKKRVLFRPDGKRHMVQPEINEKINALPDNKKAVSLNIKARDTKQARQILNGLKRKYPNIDVEQLLAQIEPKIDYTRHEYQFTFTFGGETVFRAIAKSAVNLFLHSGGDKDAIAKTIAFIKGNLQGDFVWPYYPEKDPIQDRGEDIFHTIYIKGSQKHRSLFAYIEYYGGANYIVCLSSEYAGQDCEFSHFLDPRTGSVITKNCQIDLDRESLLAAISPHELNQQVMLRYNDSMFKKIVKHQKDEQLKAIIWASMQEFSKKFPNETAITSKYAAEYTDILMKHLRPYIIANFPRNL